MLILTEQSSPAATRRVLPWQQAGRHADNGVFTKGLQRAVADTGCDVEGMLLVPLGNIFSVCFVLYEAERYNNNDLLNF